jgi:hypothetical protein
MTVTLQLELASVDPFDLVVERTLGTPADAVRSRVSIGFAVPYLVTEEAVSGEPALVAALREHGAYDYYALAFVCSFVERDGECIEGATFSVVLSIDGEDESNVPIAWSLWPDRLSSKPVHRTKSAGLTVGVSLAADLTIKGEHSGEYDEEQCYVVAAGEREPDPEWTYRRTKTISLDGSHEMSLIAQVPKGRDAKATYGVTATVVRPRLRVAYARVDVPRARRTVRLQSRR